MNIKFYDPQTDTVIEMPEDELAPGCVRITMEGMDGEYFIKAGSMDASKDPLLHGPLGRDMKDQMKYLETVFHEVFPQSAQGWEKGFRQDANPEREIALWLKMAEHYQYHTQSPVLSIKAKQEYFQIILQYVTSGEKHVRKLVQLEEVSRNEMKEVIRLMKEGLPTE